ncbi:hypothetical protein D5H75_34490 [Bailinhaonella thermotolerans]|uniref:Uncharacterized protein n=1 Tax=Bailinhaonella thermotolerans TaxID=1070861 RepID=A0A3A4A217_9ACTN|nr:hypothetical protein D5H75_34490 [Bailinhaonella thermotolerans]
MTRRREGDSGERIMARLLDGYDTDYACTDLAPHLGPRQARYRPLHWDPVPRDRTRVVRYTCCCAATYYEFISMGGSYGIRKIVQSDPPQVLYTGGWTRDVGELWWMRLLTGEAR